MFGVGGGRVADNSAVELDGYGAGAVEVGGEGLGHAVGGQDGGDMGGVEVFGHDLAGVGEVIEETTR